VLHSEERSHRSAPCSCDVTTTNGVASSGRVLEGGGTKPAQFPATVL
jgi:hypothetical protein